MIVRSDVPSGVPGDGDAVGAVVTPDDEPTGPGSFVPATLIVTCRTSPQPDAPVSQHPITIHEDWTVATGHDVAAERVLVALGGYLSCLELVDRTVPAARRWLNLNSRSVAPGITSTDGSRWRVRPRQPCCPRGGFARAADAGRHVRSVDHLAAEFHTSAQQLGELVGHWAPLLRRAARVAGGTRRDRALWQAGLSAASVRDVEQRLGALQPLPAEFHLAVHARRPDLDWLQEALTATGYDPPAATWLAWHARAWQRVDTRVGVRWLRLGIPPRLALDLAHSRFVPADVTRLAEAHRRSLTWAATNLHDWQRHGYRPTLEQLLGLLAETGAARLTPPAGGATRHARTRHHRAFESLNDTEIALLIAKHGDATSAAAAVRTHATASAVGT